MATSPVHDEDSNARNQSLRLSSLFFSLALLWSFAAITVLLEYHLQEPPGVTSITTNGHTYFGNPPALTLFERDPASFSIITATMGVGVLIGLVDLVVRHRRRTLHVGAASVAAGAVVLLISLSGSIVGIVGVGVVGTLLIASGMAHHRGDVA